MNEGKIPKAGSAERKEAPKLTPEKLAQLMYLSFKFSQGEIGLQASIFEWLHAAFPSYVITDDMVAKAKEIAIKMARAYILKERGSRIHTPEMGWDIIDETLIEKEVGRQYNVLKGVFSKLPTLTKKELTTKLIEHMAARDLNYLFLQKGRPGDKMKMMSYLVVYALNGKPTGVAEFDQMFKEIGERILQEKHNISVGQPGSLFPHTLEEIIKIEKLHSDE